MKQHSPFAFMKLLKNVNTVLSLQALQKQAVSGAGPLESTAPSFVVFTVPVLSGGHCEQESLMQLLQHLVVPTCSGSWDPTGRALGGHFDRFL